MEAKTAVGRLTPEDQQRFDTRAQVIMGLAKAQRDIERSQHPTKRARLEDGIATPTHLELETLTILIFGIPRRRMLWRQFQHTRLYMTMLFP